MKKQNTLTLKILPVIGTFLLLIVFATAFRQAPLYRLNQHVYLLHGYADAGMGFLEQDWQVNTTDTVPVFSALVSAAVQIFGENAFYFLLVVNLAIFCFSIMGLVREVIGNGFGNGKLLTFFILITIWYSGMLAGLLLRIPWLSQFAPIVGQNSLLTDGVAGQYILGTYFQPSTFGVLVILSIYLFIKEKPFVAVICLAIASTVHSTYLLSSAVLTATYMGMMVRKNREYRKALVLGAVTLVLVAPILIYFVSNFSPTSPEVYAEARDIIVNYRIPHHALVSEWFDATTVVQIVLVGLAIYLVRHTKLFTILLVSFLAALALSIVQVITGSEFLAVLFPWRISVYLVPISTALILAKIISWGFRLLDKPVSKIRKPLQITLIAAVLILGLLGVRQVRYLFTAPREGVTPAVEFVRSSVREGDLYLIPIEEMSYFRIAARAPIFVDFKSHPYKDVEVVEWFKRLNLAHNFYSSSGEEACTDLKDIESEYKINHVIFFSKDPIPDCRTLQEIYSDKDVSIFTIQRAD